MPGTFNLPVEFNSHEYELPTQILRYGYTYKVRVEINKVTVTFEPDELPGFDRSGHIPLPCCKKSATLTALLST